MNRFGEGVWWVPERGSVIRFLEFLCWRVFSTMLMQSMSVDLTRSILENISPDRSCGGFNVSRLCCALDEPRADSASLMHPSIDRETRSTPSSSSELTILGRLIDLR